MTFWLALGARKQVKKLNIASVCTKYIAMRPFENSSMVRFSADCVSPLLIFEVEQTVFGTWIYYAAQILVGTELAQGHGLLRVANRLEPHVGNKPEPHD